MKKKTTELVKKHPNPRGKGGFGDHPEHQSPGGWNPKYSFSYQMNRFKAMTVKQLKDWYKNTAEDKKTVTEELAYKRVIESRNSLRDFQEVANRTEGMPRQDITSGGEKIEFPTIYKPEKKEI